MDSPESDDYVPTFYIGQHESDRVRVTPELLHQAQDCNVSNEEPAPSLNGGLTCPTYSMIC